MNKVFTPTSSSLNQDSRIKSLFNEDRRRNYSRTDRMFAVLMVVQWLVSMIFAVAVAPTSWGTSASQHISTAIFVGGVLTMIPCFLALKFPGSVITRHSVAISQLGMSGLLIHLTGGRIETHFHIFGSLAFLAFYRDWKVLITATVVTALDHLFRGMFFPASLFGAHMDHVHSMTDHLGRVVEHASYVIFEDIILVIGCITNVREIRSGAAKQVEVELANNELNAQKLGVEAKIEAAVRESDLQKRQLTESVGEMLQKMERFADGDLRVRMTSGKEGEIGRLFEGFNQAVENTGRLLSQVTEAVNTVADAANQINVSTEQLDNTTKQQTTQTTQVASAMTQMASASIESARIGKLTAQAATESGDTARQGQLIVTQSTAKMSRIAEVVRTSAQTVEVLGNSGNEIGKIISVIDDIADRTNLLALNAAIEAARAGQAGLGFAVVADEVRNLAERTRTATSQINEMITTVQVETTRAVKTMAIGTEEVGEGIKLSERTAEALDEIVVKSQSMIERVNQIASACEEQADSNERVTQNVQIISNATNRSADGVSQIADAACKLTELTEQLRSLTSHFKLDGVHSGMVTSRTVSVSSLSAN